MIWLKMIGKMMFQTLAFIVCLAMTASNGQSAGVSIAAVLLFFWWLTGLIITLIQTVRRRRPPAGPSEEPKEAVALDPEPEADAPRPIATAPASRAALDPDEQIRQYRDQVLQREQQDRAEELKDEIEQAFAEYGLDIDIIHIEFLDYLTRFEFYPEAGKRIIAYSKLADDVALSIGAVEKPLIDRVPGKNTIGVTVINASVNLPVMNH